MFAPENEKANYVRYQPADTAHLTLHPATSSSGGGGSSSSKQQAAAAAAAV
jgi:hypothetical protein